MNELRSRFETVVGWGVALGLLAGALALVVAVFAFFSYDWLATGVCLGAAGLAFAETANALLRA
ncbi:MAG: hypothetical protein ACP5HS_09165 [Anaerolineae bacterium]